MNSPMWVLESDALNRFLSELGVETGSARPYKISVWSDEGSLKVKVNEFTWSPPLAEAVEAP